MASAKAPGALGAEIREEVEGRRAEWVEYAASLGRLESPSTHPEAQRPIQDLIGGSLEELGYRVRRVPGVSSGGLILATPRGDRGTRFQLLLGHTDTVWPLGTLDRMPVELDGPVLRGPGIFDMKGGLTHAVVALRALARLDLSPEIAPVFLFNSDEETGSLESTRHIERLARGASRVLVLEPALGVDGRIKTARKGVGRFRVVVRGRGAHTGLDPTSGASAIQELAHVVHALHELTDLERGLVVNVGEIQGGITANVVAPEARAEVDVRIASVADGPWVESRIREIQPKVSGCSIHVEGGIERPPMERTPRNRALWEAAREVGESMDIALEDGFAGGASDGNTTSLAAPTLDGLGAVGDGAHADHEHAHVDRSMERCALLAGLLLLPALPSA